MASLRAFERELKIATAGLEPQAINKLLAQTAHQALEEAQAAGEAPESFIRYVNGREGVAEESVEAPGPIVYVFSWLNEVANTRWLLPKSALPFCRGGSNPPGSFWSTDRSGVVKTSRQTPR
jgi:hypothetical protein